MSNLHNRLLTFSPHFSQENSQNLPLNCFSSHLKFFKSYYLTNKPHFYLSSRSLYPQLFFSLHLFCRNTLKLGIYLSWQLKKCPIRSLKILNLSKKDPALTKSLQHDVLIGYFKLFWSDLRAKEDILADNREGR